MLEGKTDKEPIKLDKPKLKTKASSSFLGVLAFFANKYDVDVVLLRVLFIFNVLISLNYCEPLAAIMLGGYLLLNLFVTDIDNDLDEDDEE